MNILVLYAHPVETSFNAGLHKTIVEHLAAGGHAVDDCDLYAEDFDPRMTRAERLGYHDPRGPDDAVAGYVERLKNAEALVLSFPVWNYGYPAILKGSSTASSCPACRSSWSTAKCSRHSTTSASSRPSPPMAAAAFAPC